MTLYIIGNGFDRHHGIESGYDDYKSWLEKYDPDLLERLRAFYDVDDAVLWWHFEEQLGNPEMHDYIDDIAADNQPDYGSDDFHDADYHNAEVYADDEIGELVKDIKATFSAWIASLSKGDRNRMIHLHADDALFLNFNYTDTLQDLYGIPPENTLFIHGRVSVAAELVLGHGRTYDELEKAFVPQTPTPPADAIDEELADWYDTMQDLGEDYIHQSARYAAAKQLSRLRKDTQSIIKQHQQFFDSLDDVRLINIYGLSFSPIDFPYIEEVFRHVDRNTVQCQVSYKEDKDIKRARAAFERLQIPPTSVEYVLLEDLVGHHK